MALDIEELILGPTMAIFGEGSADDPSSWPTYRVQGGGKTSPIADAVFDAQYQRVTDLGDGPVSSYHPVLGVRDAVFAALGVEPKQGGTVFIPSAGKLFAVQDVQPDGHGHTLLILVEAAR